MMPPSGELRERVLAAARQAPSPNRAQVTVITRSLAALALVASLTVFFAIGGVNLGTRPVGFVVATAVGWGLLAAFGTRLAFVRGKSMLGPTRQSLLLATVLMAPFLFAWAVMWTMPWPEVRAVDSSWPSYLRCFMWTGILGLVPLVALAIARRGSDPVHPRSTGAALGAAMGAWAGTLIDLHCTCASVPHIAFSHVLPTLALALLGALAGPRILGL